MLDKRPQKLVIGISSRALFDLSASHMVYQEKGLDAYSKYQIEHEDDIFGARRCFAMVNKLLNINQLIGGDPRVEVILLSRNSADTGLRVFNSINHYGLKITRAAFTGARALSLYSTI